MKTKVPGITTDPNYTLRDAEEWRDSFLALVLEGRKAEEFELLPHQQQMEIIKEKAKKMSFPVGLLDDLAPERVLIMADK